MRTLEVEFTATVKGEEFKHSFDFTDNEQEQDVLEAIAEAYNEENEEAEVTADDVEGLTYEEPTEAGGLIDSSFDLYTFANYYCNSEQDADVLAAAFVCDITPENVDEAYNGSYDSDEDFARDMADQIGAVDKNATWPNNCIDWDFAARELMYDYSEDNGHYFRNF